MIYALCMDLCQTHGTNIGLSNLCAYVQCLLKTMCISSRHHSVYQK